MFKRKSTPYTQEDIAKQQAIVAEAMKQRDSLSVTKREEYARASTSVECAQEILNFMLEEVISSHKK